MPVSFPRFCDSRVSNTSSRRRCVNCHAVTDAQLSWNNISVFPYSTFNWIGLDGSQVLSHMTPVDSYNSQADVDELVKGTTKHKNLEVTDQALLLFGNGDGGGGSTSLMLEKVGQGDHTDLVF
jgi:alpha-mannosidase